jgi:DNA repair photolyase
MGDARCVPLADVRVGDVVYGTVRQGHYRRYVRTRVLAHWRTTKPAFRVLLDDGEVLVASGDHRFLTQRGWKHVWGTGAGRGRRPHLTPGSRLLGIGPVEATPALDAEYQAGYLCGMVRGDGHLRSYSYARRGRANGDQHRFRLALTDEEALHRTARFLEARGIATKKFDFLAPSETRRGMKAIRTSARAAVDAIRSLVRWPEAPGDSWSRGFLAGLFDAEGSHSRGILRIANTDESIVRQAGKALERFGFDVAVESRARPPLKDLHYLRVRGGVSAHGRFFRCTDPAIARKRLFEGTAVKNPTARRVVSVEPLEVELPMFDVTTGTGDFVANGVISHNCYARPSHQYLGFGAGTDFERRIVVKTNAPEALRRTLRSRSWEGEEIVFSGNTDCYQPLEACYRLTRRCLEACLDHRNPVALITKGVLVRRDVDVLGALAREAGARVHFSVPFASDRVARAMEPGVASPVRRFEAMKALADAGVPVGLSLAPLIPGLNDHDVPTLLRRAKDAGATSAFITMLRLPGEVREVFAGRLSDAFPERASHVLSQVSDARGGRLNESAFGSRMTGRGPRWDAAIDLFEVHARRVGLATHDGLAAGSRGTYRRDPAQGTLFDPA